MFRQPHGLFPGSAQSHELANNQVLKVGDSESETFWAEFISHLKERGLDGVKLVISDARSGLTKAIRRQLQGCVWQRRTERCAW
jgi:transposase-like protein